MSLLQALHRLGFGSFFYKCVKMLYNNANSSIRLSNGTSPRFSLKRGVRQGCPISPYLFLIATQFLCFHIKESPVKGISVAGTELIISQLADDTALFLRDASQIPIALKSLLSFSNASGLLLNINKCELLPIKKCAASSICNIPIKENVAYLGIKIIKDSKLRCQENFNPIMEKTKKKKSLVIKRSVIERKDFAY